MSFVTRVRCACRAFLGRDQIREQIIELLEMQPDDKLLICYKSPLSQDAAARLRERFDAALKSDKRIMVMDGEVPKFIVVRGLPKLTEIGSQEKAA